MGADDRRTERRDFIRAHHPDRGGDPAEFVAGLRQFDCGPTTKTESASLPRVAVYTASAWPIRLVKHFVQKFNKPHPRVR